MIPESGTIKISLLGNDKEIFDNTSVANVSGFDLSEFNSISQSKFPYFFKKKPRFYLSPMLYKVYLIVSSLPETTAVFAISFVARR